MELKELILLYITIVGFISYIPQIIRMIKQKSSRDVSVLTWAFWFVNSGLYLLYLCISDVTIWLILSQVLEVCLIGLTFFVVVVYRLKNREPKFNSSTGNVLTGGK